MIRLQNLSTEPQRSWVFIGAPDGGPIPIGAVRAPGGFFAWADLAGGQVLDVHDGDDLTPPKLQVSPWVLDEPDRVVPRFLCWTRDRSAAWWADKPTFGPMLPHGPGWRVTAQWRIPQLGLTVDGVFDVLPGQDFVPFNLKVTFGDVGTTVLYADLGALSMVSGERPAVADAKRKGVLEPTWKDGLGGGIGAWEQVLTPPRPWGKACRSRFRGILLCLPAGERWDPSSTEPRHAMLRARAKGPICGVGDWTGKWGAFGEVPAVASNSQDVAEIERIKFDNPNAGEDYDLRPLAPWKEAGQTGPDPDFGCSRGEFAVSMRLPWAVEDYLYQAESWALRPTGNLELDGGPMRAANHPHCETYNQRPADRRQVLDMLGNPDPYPYSWPGPGYSTMDDQHRSDNGLVTAIALAQDVLAIDVVRDCIELDLMRVRAPLGTPTASPRDWGRTLMAWSDYLWLGFDMARLLIQRSIDSLWAGASYRRLGLTDAAHTVRVFSDAEGKYGWLRPGGTDPNADMVRAWLPWQESICAMGCWAAWKQTGDGRAYNMALTVSETVVRHGFSKASGQWRAAYGCRWREEDPGAPLPEEAFPYDGPTADHFGYPMQQWMMGAVLIAKAHSADILVVSRAAELLAAFPIVTQDDACWRAVGA